MNDIARVEDSTGIGAADRGDMHGYSFQNVWLICLQTAATNGIVDLRQETEKEMVMPTDAIIITAAVTAVIGTLALIMAWADHQSTIHLREKREKEDNH